MMSDEHPVEDPLQTESLGMQEASVQSLLDEEQTVVKERTDEETDSNPLPTILVNSASGTESDSVNQFVKHLHEQAETLKREIAELETTKAQLQQQVTTSQTAIAQMVREGLKELEQRKRDLQISIEKLERRQERIREEMRTTFAGVSQDLAIRVQSFKEYLVGSLQDLAIAADQLEFPQPEPIKEPEKPLMSPEVKTSKERTTPQFAEMAFQDQTKKIRNLIDQYRNQPDYYGPPWQLRRTFEPIHAERVSTWFFTQGGRGAIRTMGSRLQNILIASAIVSILYSLYGDRVTALVLAESPERLGEWRRGLQDCLGITRADFGMDRGAALFEDPIVLVQKAERLQKDGYLPLIIIDETEAQIDLAVLQFPLWLAFAPNPQTQSYSRDWI